MWEPPFRFVDVQTRGPYRLWRHEHRFEQQGEETILHDDVTYAVWGPRLIQEVFVGRSIERIFAYRRERIARTFETEAGGACPDARPDEGTRS